MKIHTVGDLRKAIKNLPSDQLIIPQIISEDGTVFLAQVILAPIPGSSPNMSVISMSHPNLHTCKGLTSNQLSEIDQTCEEILEDDNRVLVKDIPCLKDGIYRVGNG